tara:strand:- start:318 stop:554 length:237 start_codon:yes stop_codon:yes gene_type:complete
VLLEARLKIGVEDRLEIEEGVRLETGVEDGSGGTTGAKLEVEGKTRLVEEGEDIKFSAKDFLCALVKGFLIVRAMEIF